jgi:NAD(P)-dependent dehydrogenase (short-subunit alcohol dehydrogenase family)
LRPVEGQTILVTGATDGLGHALALDLARRGATVLLHGRSDARLSDAARELREATGSARLRAYRAAFSSLDEVRRLAERVLAEERLDVLVNNAGIGAGPPGTPRQESADGYELRFAANYLAPFLLTNALLLLLRRSAPARIVNFASAGQVPLDFGDLMLERDHDGGRAYRQSKLAEVMFTFELAERLDRAGEPGVTVNALHPATFMNTKMARVRRLRDEHDRGRLEATLRLAIAPRVRGCDRPVLRRAPAGAGRRAGLRPAGPPPAVAVEREARRDRHIDPAPAGALGDHLMGVVHTMRQESP